MYKSSRSNEVSAAMARYVVGPARELPPGTSKIVNVAGRSIGVFNVKGEYYALRNVCPHQAAPLCLGEVTGAMMPSRPGEFIYGRDGEIVRCPWHGWEFDIKTGKSFFNPHRVRVRTYEVTVESGQVPCRAAEPEDPSVETFDVTVEDEMVILHV